MDERLQRRIDTSPVDGWAKSLSLSLSLSSLSLFSLILLHDPNCNYTHYAGLVPVPGC